jgi:hypothetical protein
MKGLSSLVLYLGIILVVFIILWVIYFKGVKVAEDDPLFEFQCRTGLNPDNYESMIETSLSIPDWPVLLNTVDEYKTCYANRDFTIYLTDLLKSKIHQCPVSEEKRCGALEELL